MLSRTLWTKDGNCRVEWTLARDTNAVVLSLFDTLRCKVGKKAGVNTNQQTLVRSET